MYPTIDAGEVGYVPKHRPHKYDIVLKCSCVFIQGKSTRTVDSELEAQIEQLRDTQRKYLQILRLTRALGSHFHHVVQTQHCLSEAFSDLAQKSPELQQEFLYNSETQRSLTKNGELLLAALNFFVSSVNTLCNKTIEDTLITIRQYEVARWVHAYSHTALVSL